MGAQIPGAPPGPPVGAGPAGPAPAPSPSPAGDPGAPVPGAAGGPGAGAPSGGSPQEILKGVINIGKQIEQTLTMFAQAMPNGARYFQQANEAIQQGIAAEVAAAGNEGGAGGEQAPASSPTEAGNPFPGGGFGSAGRP